MWWTYVVAGVLCCLGPGAMARDPFRIMPFGDSLTQGGKGHAYRRELWHMLNNSGYEFTFVGTEMRVLRTQFPRPMFGVVKSDFPDMWHESWAGRRTLDLMRTVSVARSMRAAMPDIVLFLVGTNDILAGDQPARTAVNIRKVVSEMHQVNPSVTILLSLLIPTYASDGAVRRAKELNRILPSVVSNVNQQLQKQTRCNRTTIVDPTAHCHLDGRHRHVDRKDREKEMACYQERLSRDTVASRPDVCRCRRCAMTAAELQSNQAVVLCSVGSGFVRGLLGRDATHPNAEGNALMATNWFGALKRLLPPPTRPAYVRPSPSAPLQADESAETEAEAEAGAPEVPLDAAPSAESNEAAEASGPGPEPEPSPRALPADERSSLSSGSIRTVFGLVVLLLTGAVFGRRRCPK